MSNVSVVIGANYGDEGKGLVTDYLSDHDTMVVRFNGGCQAGHTVVTPEGRRHIFHHFGSGTFRGAATMLSRFFIANPIFFKKELEELKNKYPLPGATVILDPRAMVSTPYDMLMNQLVESKRGEKRHGSCGFGINETVTRHEVHDFKSTVIDMIEDARARLQYIRNFWLPKRMEMHGIEKLPDIDLDALDNNYLRDLEYMLDSVHVSKLENYWQMRRKLVFEGAQGLRLDEFGTDFPHVTRSRTGLTNVVKLLQECKIDDVPEVFYPSRIYLTRHGAGPLKNELGVIPFDVKDETNIPNEHQGTLRFAWHDLNDLFNHIERDVKESGIKVKPNIVWTCVNQAGGELIPIFYNGDRGEVPANHLYLASSDRFGVLASVGPTRIHMMDLRF